MAAAEFNWEDPLDLETQLTSTRERARKATHSLLEQFVVHS